MRCVGHPLSLRLGLALGAAFWMCVVTPVAAQVPGTKVTVRNPDREKWMTEGAFPSTRTFICRPLACPAPSKVTVRMSRSPTRSPNKQALANYASKAIPAEIDRANADAANSLTPGRKVERISGNVSTIRGYPAIVSEARIRGGKDDVYVSRASVFAKSVVVNIVSSSTSRSLARHNRDLFIGTMVVEDRPPPR